jgi:alpha-tubulin suppressor-like RCC1 family protein
MLHNNKNQRLSRVSALYKNMLLFSGNDHTFLLKDKNDLYACGLNTYGQLGLGDNANRNEFTPIDWIYGNIKQIACGAEHSFILTDDNKIYSCGRNNEGQLGLENNKNQNIFQKINFDKGEIKEITSGGWHTFILMQNNEMYFTGWNMFESEKPGGWKYVNTFQKVEFDKKEIKEIKEIKCGKDNLFVVQNKGDIHSCGLNNVGQLGLKNNKNVSKLKKIKKNFIKEMPNLNFSIKPKSLFIEL